MPEIIVKVSKDGQTTVSVNGISGAGCRDLSASIEKAIGKTTATDLTSEYYQESQSEGMQAGQQ
jgi:hypothetical protein